MWWWWVCLCGTRKLGVKLSGRGVCLKRPSNASACLVLNAIDYGLWCELNSAVFVRWVGPEIKVCDCGAFPQCLCNPLCHLVPNVMDWGKNGGKNKDGRWDERETVVCVAVWHKRFSFATVVCASSPSAASVCALSSGLPSEERKNEKWKE